MGRLVRLALGGSHHGEDIERDVNSGRHDQCNSRSERPDIEGEILRNRVVTEVDLDVAEISPDSQKVRYQPPAFSAGFAKDGENPTLLRDRFESRLRGRGNQRPALQVIADLAVSDPSIDRPSALPWSVHERVTRRGGPQFQSSQV
jgi:hypothetical protein